MDLVTSLQDRRARCELLAHVIPDPQVKAAMLSEARQCEARLRRLKSFREDAAPAPH